MPWWTEQDMETYVQTGGRLPWASRRKHGSTRHLAAPGIWALLWWAHIWGDMGDSGRRNGLCFADRSLSEEATGEGWTEGVTWLPHRMLVMSVPGLLSVPMSEFVSLMQPWSLLMSMTPGIPKVWEDKAVQSRLIYDLHENLKRLKAAGYSWYRTTIGYPRGTSVRAQHQQCRRKQRLWTRPMTFCIEHLQVKIWGPKRKKNKINTSQQKWN